MKSVKLTKVIASLLLATSVLVLNPIGASAEWKQDSTGWWYAAGNSYYTGWQNIGGKWYYFNNNGYMLYSTIKDGYFLQSDGSWSNGGSEIQKYNTLLNDTSWQEQNGITHLAQNIIMDVNQDGKYEMLLNNGQNQATLQVSIVSYNDGNIKVQNIPSGQGGYYGYIIDEDVLCEAGGHMGYFYGSGYKLNNGNWEKVYTWSSEYISPYDYTGYKNCTLNEKSVSEAEFKQFLNKINKYNYGIN